MNLKFIPAWNKADVPSSTRIKARGVSIPDTPPESHLALVSAPAPEIKCNKKNPDYTQGSAVVLKTMQPPVALQCKYSFVFASCFDLYSGAIFSL